MLLGLLVTSMVHADNTDATSQQALAEEAAAVPVSGPRTWSQPGVQVPQAEAIERFDLKRRLMSYGSDYFDATKGAQIRVVEGDLSIDGNLVLDWDNASSYGVIVTGDLSVSGAIINKNMNGGPFLLVGGKTRAFAIVGGGAELVFEGDTEVQDIVVGHYNDGILIFKKNLVAPAVVTMDHHLEIRGTLDGRWFDTFNDDDEWSAFLDMSRPELAAMEEDEWEALESGVIASLKARRSVLRADLPPKDDYRYGR